MKLRSRVAEEQRAVWQQAAIGHQVNRTLAYDWRYTLAESDLPKVCGATRLAGVTVVFPMLDQALLPAEYTSTSSRD